MLPIEIIILGAIISILTLLERLIRYVPKLGLYIDRITRSRYRLESVRSSIKGDIEENCCEEITDLIDTLASLGEELNFIKP
jgi:hypothetical protein